MILPGPLSSGQYPPFDQREELLFAAVASVDSEKAMKQFIELRRKAKIAIPINVEEDAFPICQRMMKTIAEM